MSAATTSNDQNGTTSAKSNSNASEKIAFPKKLSSDLSDIRDVSHGEDHPRDYHKQHIWMVEHPVAQGVLTIDGMTQIAHHQYKGGSYTALDSFLSPNVWEPLTQKLPIWLAPNLITTLGGCFCLFSYTVSTCYMNNYFAEDQQIDESNITPPVPPPPPPRWLYLLNGLCMMTYYTMDCMDGKQARRTKSSSPLGQLFDHGMDCLCNLSHLRTIQCIFLFPSSLMVILQCSLQFSFWQAQWEEYYTGILPHSSGNCGVTELNYGFAMWSIVTSIFGREMYDFVILENVIVGDTNQPFQIRHVLGIMWCLMIVTLVILSWIRVYQHVQNPKIFASALSKILSPVLLCVLASPDGMLGLGLCFCLITIKIIVYSMARMAYASIQMDILPYCLAIIVNRYVLEEPSDGLYYLIDMYYFARLMYWIHEAIRQLCERLEIHLFRIPVIEENKEKAS